MTGPSISPGSGAPQPLRRRLLKLFLLSSIATAGAALTYRLGQLSRAAEPAPGSAAGMASQDVLGTIKPGQRPTVTPALLAASPEGAVSEPLPRATQDPALGETAMPDLRPTPVATQGVSKPLIITQQAWGGRAPTRGFLPQRPSRITLHHEGVYFDGSKPAPAYLRRVQIWSMDTQGWPDLPYHFLIDREGLIYEGRPLEARGDTNTAYNLQDHALIALLGKYDEGEQQPNQSQIDATIVLMSWIADAYSIDPDTIRGHRDFIPINAKGEHIDLRTGERITCPGDNLYRFLADGTIPRGVAQLLARSHTQPQPEVRYGDRQ